jgi:hypothetical protein
VARSDQVTLFDLYVLLIGWVAKSQCVKIA